ncbi:MAG: VIT domain-containing protein [Woeseiaceae bacterium]|nr:VIT domain-containing protein [Woeseiaceae bacterium]
MKTDALWQGIRKGGVLLLTVAVVTACASGTMMESVPDSGVASTAPTAPVSGGEGEIQEIIVTGNRAYEPTRREELVQRKEERALAEDERKRIADRARQQLGVLAADYERERQAAFADDDAGSLSRVLPGEEVWVIARNESAATVDKDRPGSGSMLTLVGDEASSSTYRVPLPLQHTAVNARVDGYIGTVDVTQRFENPFSTKIEAVYVFPLPEKSAVTEFVMVIGERRIRGILREKEQAKRIYAEARRQGYQASLLLQERPNIFQQKVANIEPGKAIDVEIRYFHSLAYSDGWYSFVFPTVVGPRFNPPSGSNPVEALARGTLPAADAAVTYLHPSERSGHDINIDVTIDAGVPIEGLRSSHTINAERQTEGVARVTLASESVILNRDFTLDFKVAGDTVRSNLLTWQDPESGRGYFTMMLYPPENYDALPRQPMEMVFVIDCSGSMSGQPLKQAKSAILAALDQLEPDDTFQVVRFSSNASQLGEVPLRATPENIAAAKRYVRNLDDGGGTMMIEGIRAALAFPQDPQRLRFVTFLTDGYIGNEADIIGEVNRLIGDARVFSFGVGNSVNRYLMERMAKEGRGAVAYLGLDDSGAEVMDAFFARISRPALTNLVIDWGSMQASSVYPSKLPDLFVGRPVFVTGRYTGVPSTITVSGLAGGATQQFAVEGVSEGGENLAKLWARSRIADLADRRTWQLDVHGELADDILATALEHELMSEFTAFVAVDASRQTEGAHGVTVQQAVPVPDGVRYETTVTEGAKQ